MVRFTEAGPKKKKKRLSLRFPQSVSHAPSGGSALLLWKESSLVFIKPGRKAGSRNSVPLVQSMPKVSPVQSLPPSG